MTLLVVILLLVLVFGVGGGTYNGGAYRNYGYGGAGFLVVLLVILWALGIIHV